MQRHVMKDDRFHRLDLLLLAIDLESKNRKNQMQQGDHITIARFDIGLRIIIRKC
jgi:hypothetical protein